VNDAQSSAWDTNQDYLPLSNDSADASTSLNTSSIKLCPTNATSPYNSTNCSLSSVTVTGEGVYTLAGTKVTFNPDATFFGVVSTPIRYVVADSLGQYASATITPTIGPKATPDTLSLAPGATSTFLAITGVGGLATGASLNTSGTFLCGSGETAPNCTATSVTISGVGVYTLNQSTGVVTLVAAANATAGIKASLTYIVTDSTGLKASSTLTPTIVVPPPTPAPSAVNDAKTSAWDTNQSYTPLDNDSADASTSLNSSSLKLCPVGASPPYNASNCSLTSVTVTGQGVYTLSGSNVIFNPDATFFGVVSTPIRYVVADALGQYASALITPTIGPKATPDTLSLAPGTSASFAAITGAGGLATGANLNTSGTFLCGAGEVATACTATSVTIAGVGIYTLNQSTGVVTLAADPNATAGVKAALTYVVTDSTGLKASATLTPTIAVLPPAPTAVNDAQSSAWDTNQTYSPMSNDSSDSSTALNNTKFKLCAAGATAPYNATNCSLTTLTIAGQGVYTLSGTTVIFNPDASFFGTVSTPARYVIADGFNQFASALITPTIGPKATPDTLSLAAGATASFRTITGGSGLATGSNLNTSRTYLCGSGQTAPNCTDTATVTVAGVGIYTLNQSTGVVTLVADANATAGTKASLTYVVTDGNGMTASSTLTPTIPAPNLPQPPTPVVEPEPTPPPISVAMPDTTTDFKGKVQSMNLLTNDKPGTGLTLEATTLKFCSLGQTTPNCTASSVVIPSQGTYAVGLGGVVTFTPEANFVGTATALPYVVKDSYGRTINSTYTPIVRDTPSATPDSSSGPFQQTQKLSILGNDTASTGSTLLAGTVRLCSKLETPPNCSASSVEIENQGVFLLGADGVVTFTPTKTFTGTATTINYQVADSSGQIASSTITVIVGPPPPNPPKAVDDVRTTPMNVSISLDATPNDIPGTFPLVPKTVRLCTPTESIGTCTNDSVKNATGVFTVDTSAGTVTFTPTPGWTGVTKVPYIVKDTAGLIAPAYITITITPPAYLKLKELAWTGPTSSSRSQSKTAIPASSAGSGRVIATLRIPRLGNNWQQTVFDGIDQKYLAKGVGYYPGTSLPGEIGNFAVAGHRVTQKQQFLNLDQLIVGDPIAVQVGNKIFLYKVVLSKIVKPSDVREIFPVPGDPSSIATKAMLTLTTCNPKYSAKERLVVHALLNSVLDAEGAPAKYKAKA
jgi:LPXTG-site transpeptidase (sortase) family protein